MVAGALQPVAVMLGRWQTGGIVATDIRSNNWTFEQARQRPEVLCRQRGAADHLVEAALNDLTEHHRAAQGCNDGSPITFSDGDLIETIEFVSLGATAD